MSTWPKVIENNGLTYCEVYGDPDNTDKLSDDIECILEYKGGWRIAKLKSGEYWLMLYNMEWTNKDITVLEAILQQESTECELGDIK